MDELFIGSVLFAAGDAPLDSTMHNWVQVSSTGETLPLKIGTAIRRASDDRVMPKRVRYGVP
jgi:hypothetical protein